MRVPEPLSTGFGQPFEDLISRFAVEKKLLPQMEDIRSNRFLSRSVIPHIKKLSSLFNRLDDDQGTGLAKYWKESSNPTNLRLAYFLYFMPSNLYRVASVWAELARLGYVWKAQSTLRGLELGAGPATGACGIAAGEHFASVGLPKTGNWALIEQDKAMLDLGTSWSEEFFRFQEVGDWGIRPFHRTIDFTKPLLPAAAPKFNLWVTSYFLNEAHLSAMQLAEQFVTSWEKHLDDEGLVIMVEPALKAQSRRLLEFRKCVLELIEKKGFHDLKVLTPCLGHQACGALAAPDDWCHEEVSWWRPPYFRVIDKLASLDRKTLPFSYLVLIRSKRTRDEILPGIAGIAANRRYRLVSPSHFEGKEREFFTCGQDGKRRARYRSKGDEDPANEVGRGDLLLDADIQGDVNSSRVHSVKKIG